jgi:two-component system, response regulator PdtaR
MTKQTPGDGPSDIDMKDTATHDVRNPPDTQAFGSSRKLYGLRVIVETEHEDQLDFLLRELRKLRTEPRLITRRASTLPSDADIILCDYSPTLGSRLPWPTGEATAAVLVMLPHIEGFSSALLEAATPDAVLARPFTANAVKASVVMGYSQFQYERRLRSKATKLEENLRAMRAIERAKSIVMTTRSLGAEEAYRFIRSQAMSRRLPVSTIAEAIVSSYDLLGGLPGA